MTEILFPEDNKELPFVIHKHTDNDKVNYQLSVKTTNDELKFLNFPRTGNMATISDQPNITRLFGTLSEDTRTTDWLEFEANQTPSGDYEIVETGTLRVGEQTAKLSEVFFNGQTLSGRWVLRKIPNVFDKSVFSEESIYIFWKPPKQKAYKDAFVKNSQYNTIQCECPIKDASAKFHELTRDEGEELTSKITTDVVFDQDTHTFEGISAAEGTWIDMYGEKYTYTPEFIVHHYDEQRESLKKGKMIKMGTQHDNNATIQGQVEDVQLFTQPIYHIRVKGIYKGPIDISDGQYGLSHESKLRSVWNEQFQSWVPFKSSTERIDVVKRPACKVCWINKVN